MQDVHNYELAIDWRGKRSGTMISAGMTAVEISAPPEFAGEAGKWTPEHLLVGAAASCLMATFVAIAEFSKITILSFQITGSGKLEKVPGAGFQFTEIRLKPEIAVADGELEKAERALQKAEKSCFVTNALKCPVVVEAKFLVASAEMAG
jgi:peroxiredoxin-like protein